MGTPSAKTQQKNVFMWRTSRSVLRWLKIRWFIGWVRQGQGTSGKALMMV
jgi:hypothetical protein